MLLGDVPVDVFKLPFCIIQYSIGRSASVLLVVEQRLAECVGPEEGIVRRIGEALNDIDVVPDADLAEYLFQKLKLQRTLMYHVVAQWSFSKRAFICPLTLLSSLRTYALALFLRFQHLFLVPSLQPPVVRSH